MVGDELEDPIQTGCVVATQWLGVSNTRHNQPHPSPPRVGGVREHMLAQRVIYVEGASRTSVAQIDVVAYFVVIV